MVRGADKDREKVQLCQVYTVGHLEVAGDGIIRTAEAWAANQSGKLAVVANGFRRTGFHRFPGLILFFVIFGLSGKEGVGFAIRILKQIGRLVHA